MTKARLGDRALVITTGRGEQYVTTNPERHTMSISINSTISDTLNKGVALAYEWAGAGFDVFPVDPKTGKPFKNSKGFHDATKDPDQIEQCWDRHPDAGVGVVPFSGGAVVSDVDNKNGKTGSDNLVSAGIALDGGQVSRSGTGFHYWYSAEGLRETQLSNGARVLDSDGNPIDGVDIRSKNGYVIAVYSPPELLERPASLRLSDGSHHTRMKVKPEQVTEWLTEHGGAPHTDSAGLHRYWTEYFRDMQGELGHEIARNAQHNLIQAAMPGDGTGTTLRRLRKLFVDDNAEWGRDWDELLAGAIGIKLNPEPIEVEPVANWSRSPAEMIALAAEGEQWLVDGLIPANGNVLFAGDPGVGKSFTMLAIAAKVATGKPFFTQDTTQGRVAYILGEGFKRFGDRVGAFQSESGVQLPENDLRFVDGGGLGVNLSDPQSVAETMAQLRQINPDLVIIDTFSMLAQVESENDNAGIAEVSRVATRMVTELGCSTIIVHHTNKGNGDVRGASAFKGNCDTVIVAKGNSHSFMLSTDARDHGKQRDGEPKRMSGFSIGSAPDGNGVLMFAKNPAKKKDEVLEKIQDALSEADGWMTRQSIVDAIDGCGRDAIDNRLKKAKAADDHEHEGIQARQVEGTNRWEYRSS